MKMLKRDYHKVAIIGCGKVGMTTAYALLLSGLCHEIVLFGRDRNKLIGEKLDLEHAMALSSHTIITATDDYADLKETDIFIFSAGAPQAPGETRLQLAEKNLALVDQMVPKLLTNSPQAILLMVTNPVDLMTYRALKISSASAGQIFGSGTLLDTARFRFHLSEFMAVNPRSIHAYVLGEHGDHSFPVISSANIGGQPLIDFPGFTREMAQEAYQKARDAAYHIIDSKGATYYGIGVSITKIVKTILMDQKTVVPLSTILQDFYGQNEMTISVPCILGHQGISKTLKVSLDELEQGELAQGVQVLQDIYQQIYPNGT